MKKYFSSYLILSFCLTTSLLFIKAPQSALGLTLSEDLLGMRKNYANWSGDRPLGDTNRTCIGNVTKDKRLIFSESVSYALFSHALKLEGENEAEAQQKFLTYWHWTKANLQRKNIDKVYSWDYDKQNYHTWISMPEYIKDNLFSWRWAELIEGTDQSGIIYQTSDAIYPANCSAGDNWQDGAQVASDGELLTAYALYLAYMRGWGDELLQDAKDIVQDIRKKIIVDFKAGVMIKAKQNIKPFNMFSGDYIDEDKKGIMKPLDEQGLIAWEGYNIHYRK
jgi:endo-1,4-beta-D-glucanase Y